MKELTRSSLILVCTVCQDLSVRKLRIITSVSKFDSVYVASAFLRLTVLLKFTFPVAARD